MSVKRIGLDLGASHIKAAQVTINADGTFTVDHQATRIVPAGAIADGRVNPAARHRVVELLASLATDPGFGTTEVVLGLNSSANVFLDQLLLPPALEEDYAEAIPALIEAAKPEWVSSDILMSWVPVGPVVTPKGPKLKVIVARVLSSFAEEVCRLVEEAGFTIVGCDLLALGTLRAVATTTRPSGDLDVVIDIGETVATTLVHHNGVPVSLVLDPDTGGAVATDRIADAMGLAPEERGSAEVAKINSLNDRGAIAQVCSDYGRMLAVRVGKTLNALSKQTGEPIRIASVQLMGGGSLIAGLGHHLATELGVTQLSWAAMDPAFQFAPAPLDAPASTGGDLIAAIGLATGRTL